MIIHGSSLSPFVRKAMAFATEKGLTLENKVSRPGTHDPAFLEASPFKKIPGFEDGDFKISDSTAIVTYLEAAHPEPNLIPLEPRARARAMWFDEFADTILVGASGKIFFNRIVGPRFMGIEGDMAAADKAEQEDMPPVLDYLESIVPESGFLLEDRLTLADIAVASPFANLMHAGLDFTRWPKAKAWADGILARPSFAAVVAKERALLGG
ncbi:MULTISPECIES: glutathione S-transferase family protein [unclassified Caulobacter]|uniref:glutathione S-transferase family protein n=1 Tax=unclassified Caulobacter TaxID=2648921 RepID=UPI000D364D91|nr:MULTISPECIES: glutathione S-transferase family protein [unclassified Caulobacter]PTS91218.1 glutathione S-transferase [Caulobacter sp. HMWF009]PTT10228.1 glutathione S-transferase [Caulobacter sp. HMWF025]